MTDTPSNARPSQVTVGGWGVVGSATMLLVSIFDTMGRLHSVDLREELIKALTTGSGRNLGLGVDRAIELIRIALLAGGAAAAAAAILGWFVLQRHRGARAALVVCLVPIIVVSPFAGGFLCALVGASVAMLWTRPARDWFAGRPIRQLSRPAQRALPPLRERPAPPVVTPPAGDQAPAPTQGFGVSRATAVLDAAPPADRQRSRVPRPVLLAATLAFGFSVVTALLCVAGMVALAVRMDDVVHRITSSPGWDRVLANPQWQQLDQDPTALLPAILWVGVLMLLAWCVTSAVLAFLTVRRHNWARWMLMLSAFAAAFFSLLALPISLLHLAATGAVVGLLLSQPARAWFAGDRSPGPPPPPPPGPPTQQAHPGERPKVW